MDDTYVVINLLYESENKINNVFKIIKKQIKYDDDKSNVFNFKQRPNIYQ